MQDIAILVHDAYKAFDKPGHPWQRRSRPTNGKPVGAVAVDHVTFQVHKGEIFGVLGPNGSGKSTLVRLIATLLLPDGGKVSVFGHDVVGEPMAVQRLINRVSVEASFFKKLSPLENLMYAARLYGLDGSSARQEIRWTLARLGIEASAMDQPVEDMSRGMQQKVAIARALLTRPPLLLLDEPTTGLDPRSKREVHSVVREMIAQHGTTVLLTTHDMAEAEAMCHRVAIMDRGQIVALDTPSRLKALVLGANDGAATLEGVFLELTGKRLTDEPGTMRQAG